MQTMLYKVYGGWLIVHYIDKPSYENSGSIHSVFIADPFWSMKPELVTGEEE